jgi:hypothetical protein
VTPGQTGTRVSARIDDTVVWFESDAFADTPERGDPFLTVALLTAMAADRPLDLSELPPVSATLLGQLPALLQLWTQWNPWLHPVDVDANPASDQPVGVGAGAFFSGGVDAVHAALDATGPGDRLVYLTGFDFVDPGVGDHAARRRVARLAATLERDLIAVRTNWITWRRERHLSGGLMHGSCLAACAQLLGVGQMTIASSNSWARLTPWGSHPMLDPLWSNGRTTLRHWGSHRTRIEKCARLASRPDLVRDLWVCHEREETNCGRCAKCIRTRLMFHIVGHSLPVDPAVGDADPILAYSRLVTTGSELAFIEELRQAAEQSGDPHLHATLRRAERRLSRWQLLRDARRLMRPGLARRRIDSTDLKPWGYGPPPAAR